LSKEQQLEHERNDLSYRTGVKLTTEEFLKALQKEQWFAGERSIAKGNGNGIDRR
jgi:hypothetical protein